MGGYIRIKKVHHDIREGVNADVLLLLQLYPCTKLPFHNDNFQILDIQGVFFTLTPLICKWADILG